MVVGVGGSHLAHALYAMADFGTVVILNPPERAYPTIADLAPFCKLHAGMFICTPNDDGSFSADVEELFGFIDDALDDGQSLRGGLERFLESLCVEFLSQLLLGRVSDCDQGDSLRLGRCGAVSFGLCPFCSSHRRKTCLSTYRASARPSIVSPSWRTVSLKDQLRQPLAIPSFFEIR